jgi:hypothetical protein
MSLDYRVDAVVVDDRRAPAAKKAPSGATP